MLAPVPAGVGMMRHAARHADNTVDAGRTLARAYSFAAVTPVHPPMGLAAIEDLVYGDQLLARSETTGNLTYKRILDAYNHYHTDGLTITVGNSEGQRETIVATGEHPFYVIGRGFTRADELTAGQHIATHTQQPVEVLEVDLSPLELVAYNYTVEDYETYFVGEFGLWVHNACRKGVNDLISESRPGRATSGPSTIYNKDGGLDRAKSDFDALQPTDVRQIETSYGPGRTGILEDGRQVTIRPGSTEGVPTLEILEGRNRIKFRYGE